MLPFFVQPTGHPELHGGTRRGAGGGRSPRAPARRASAGARGAPGWGSWVALLPALLCGCSLEGLSAEWDASSASTGAAGGGEGNPLAREAERCARDGRFMVETDPSGVEYVVVPEDAGCHGDRVECRMEVGEAGSYQIKVKVAVGPNPSTDNSFLVRVDRQPEAGIVYSFSGAEFHLDRVKDSKADDAEVLVALDPGEHTVSFECREDGARLDWVGLVRIGP
ncbi:uncharacterized protein SOCEGT47_039460 [Sorangium cellulosum]|uniref:Uncharacterized protein n=1 Tax=Sorangium cellulosum TaxID=56 RepID=A0A4P2Q2S4_SORCE|nr:hypothetical protein [Sorangium cellulosum]AUX23421.1 uncharacterized protein SOCEGT47_039460 [Sorangium cellulosum]